jgi:hypothetical protein
LPFPHHGSEEQSRGLEQLHGQQKHPDDPPASLLFSLLRSPRDAQSFKHQERESRSIVREDR